MSIIIGHMLKVFMTPCLKCLQVCPGCKAISEERKRQMAEAAVIYLKIRFPELFPDPEPEKDQS